MVLARSLIILGLCSLLVACQEEQATETSPKPQALKAIDLPIPKPIDKPIRTDVVNATGKTLTLWDDASGCKLQINEQAAEWIKPTAPCYFMRSPASDKPQVFQKDRDTRVMVIVGTPAGKKARCGLELVGLVIKGKQVTVSENIRRGSVYCADNGLDNFQYTLF